MKPQSDDLERFRVNAGRPLPEAIPGTGGLESPCKACPVRHLSVCGGLAPHELPQLSALLTQFDAAPGEDLIYEGDAADSAYIVTEGVVKLYKLLPDGRCQVTGFLFPGHFLALSHGDVYACSAQAVTMAKLCRFKKTAFDRFLEDHPHVAKRLLDMSRDDLASQQEQLLLLGRKTAKERIASFLLHMVRDARRRGEDERLIYLPMSRSDTGDFLGLTTETVSRCFTQLRKSGFIALRAGGWVDILDPDGLQELAEGL